MTWEVVKAVYDLVRAIVTLGALVYCWRQWQQDQPLTPSTVWLLLALAL